MQLFTLIPAFWSPPSRRRPPHQRHLHPDPPDPVPDPGPARPHGQGLVPPGSAAGNGGSGPKAGGHSREGAESDGKTHGRVGEERRREEHHR